MRAGLETLPEGAALAAQILPDVEVTPYWRLRAAGAHRSAARLVELEQLSWGARLGALARILVPSPAMMRLRDPELAGRGRVGLGAAYLRRLGQGAASLPRAVREARAARR